MELVQTGNSQTWMLSTGTWGVFRSHWPLKFVPDLCLRVQSRGLFTCIYDELPRWFCSSWTAQDPLETMAV